ncbi:hypothetical protein BLNAU_1464 [Blattamonas nauphoetae]|uniref:Uncharacterized protein n=1 Tax=Blattamonas nauphoetae TaxID=2049346 RepID=A0ABQ9YI32_9EUKA|nr:hypothetical protein BLNAU_1464 [Blattamonas nauphoetae]
MSERTSLAHQSINSISTVGGDGFVADVALSPEIPTDSLASHLRRFESGNERVAWTRLMEWFVEGVMGIELFRNDHRTAPPLTSDNIRIDVLSTIVIAFPSSPDEPSIAGTLSSDISMLCQFFLHQCRTLNQLNRLTIPLDPKQEDIVFSRIMVALVEHFVASGDLILPTSSPSDHFQYFAECFRQVREYADFSVDPSLIDHLAPLFVLLVLHNNNLSFFPAENSFLCGDAVESSEELLDAVKKVKETHSLETVRNDYFDWTEWVRMMEMVELGVVTLTDLSFLQSDCFRAALLSLQTKHQLRVIPHPFEANNETSSTANEIGPFNTRSAREVEVLSNWSDVHPSHHSSTLSTQTSLPSQHTSSDSQSFTTEQMVVHAGFFVRHSRRMIFSIHTHLARQHPNSLPWEIRPSLVSVSFLDSDSLSNSHFLDENKKFDLSLFDETDDEKLVASLRRCRAVVAKTKSTHFIADVHAFWIVLISGLRSSNEQVSLECYLLFLVLADLISIVDDPRPSDFLHLRTSFRDGTCWEKVTLLQLWVRWLEARQEGGHGQMMSESDFDFDGFLSADMSNTLFFDIACRFVNRVVMSDAASMSFGWKMDFLLSFEKKYQMLSRLTSDPSPSSHQTRSTLFLSPHAISLGSFLSVFCGCDFPSALTELITIDLESSPHEFSYGVNPVFYLNHTSIAPKHRHSFFPMDLMFERFFRSDPAAFFRGWPEPYDCAQRRFLFTPFVGLHALLHRSPKLNLDQQGLWQLIRMLFVNPPQNVTRADIQDLFHYFPPPRLFHTLLSSPHFFRATIDDWICFLSSVGAFGEYTCPFGACSSLAKVFKMLAPLERIDYQTELDMLIPPHFDSPFLCHLPSLAGAQRGVLQILSTLSGIPSLVTTDPIMPDWNSIRAMISAEMSVNDRARLLSQSVRYLAYDDHHSSTITPLIVKFLAGNLLCDLPAVVSAALEFFHRFVRISPDIILLYLVRFGLLDCVVDCCDWDTSGENPKRRPETENESVRFLSSLLTLPVILTHHTMERRPVNDRNTTQRTSGLDGRSIFEDLRMSAALCDATPPFPVSSECIIRL